MMQEVKDGTARRRVRGRSRISAKNQVTLPVEALRAAGLHPGDRVRIDARGPGELRLTVEPDPLAAYAGRLRGTYGPRYLEELRREWD